MTGHTGIRSGRGGGLAQLPELCRRLQHLRLQGLFSVLGSGKLGLQAPGCAGGVGLCLPQLGLQRRHRLWEVRQCVSVAVGSCKKHNRATHLLQLCDAFFSALKSGRLGRNCAGQRRPPRQRRVSFLPQCLHLLPQFPGTHRAAQQSVPQRRDPRLPRGGFGGGCGGVIHVLSHCGPLAEVRVVGGHGPIPRRRRRAGVICPTGAKRSVTASAYHAHITRTHARTHARTHTHTHMHAPPQSLSWPRGRPHVKQGRSAAARNTASRASRRTRSASSLDT